LTSQIRVIFVGQSTPFNDGFTIEDYVGQENLNGAVDLTGFVSRQKSLQYMLEGDVMLLIIGRVPPGKAGIYGISAKIYDYTFARKPVLTIAEEGASAALARLLKIGEVVSPDNEESIANAVAMYHQMHREGRLKCELDEEVASRFNYENLTGKLAECLGS
jgi:hypothetical protein